MNIKKDDLWTFEDVCKYGQDNSRWLCIGANGKDYDATFTRKYNPKGTMFFCIPYDVEIIGYLQII